MDGVILSKIKDSSKLATSGMLEGDVIIGVEGEVVKNISELLTKYQENLWHGRLKLTISRHQQKKEVILKLQ
jgi:S1-C subfamily serine protease